jgi:hypothetical protein
LGEAIFPISASSTQYGRRALLRARSKAGSKRQKPRAQARLLSQVFRLYKSNGKATICFGADGRFSADVSRPTPLGWRTLRCVESKDRKAAADNGRYPAHPHWNDAPIQGNIHAYRSPDELTDCDDRKYHRREY